jgi:hypothetical protein
MYYARNVFRGRRYPMFNARLFLVCAFTCSMSGISLADSVDCSRDAACLSALVHPANGTSASSHATTESASPRTTTKELGFTPGLSVAPTTETVWLAKGTYFPVQTMQSYSSYGAGVGSKLRFELAQDVIVNGHLVAMAGDTAEGTVQNAMTGGAFFGIDYRGADLRVSVDRVFNFCGDIIAVDFDRTEFRKDRVGVFDGNVDVHIIRGQTYLAFTDRPQRVCGTRTDAADPPVAASLNALGTTTR